MKKGNKKKGKLSEEEEKEVARGRRGKKRKGCERKKYNCEKKKKIKTDR